MLNQICSHHLHPSAGLTRSPLEHAVELQARQPRSCTGLCVRGGTVRTDLIVMGTGKRLHFTHLHLPARGDKERLHDLLSSLPPLSETFTIFPSPSLQCHTIHFPSSIHSSAHNSLHNIGVPRGVPRSRLPQAQITARLAPLQPSQETQQPHSSLTANRWAAVQHTHTRQAQT